MRRLDSEAFLFNQSLQVGGFFFYLGGSIFGVLSRGLKWRGFSTSFGAFIRTLFHLIRRFDLRGFKSDGFLIHFGYLALR